MHWLLLTKGAHTYVRTVHARTYDTGRAGAAAAVRNQVAAAAAAAAAAAGWDDKMQRVRTVCTKPEAVLEAYTRPLVGRSDGRLVDGPLTRSTHSFFPRLSSK